MQNQCKSLSSQSKDLSVVLNMHNKSANTFYQDTKTVRRSEDNVTPWKQPTLLPEENKSMVIFDDIFFS